MILKPSGKRELPLCYRTARNQGARKREARQRATVTWDESLATLLRRLCSLP